MPNSVKRLQYIHGLLVSLMIAFILWGFSSAWLSTNRVLVNGHPSHTTMKFAYSLDSKISDSTRLSDIVFTTGELNKAPVRFGLINDWYQLTLTNQHLSPSRLTMLLDNPMADRIEIYQTQPVQGLKFLREMGDRLNQVPSPYRVLPHYNFTLAAGESIEFFIHFETTGAPYLPITVLEQQPFEEYKNILHLIWGTFIGIVLLMSAYNLVLYFGVGDRAYFLYICYIITMMLELGVVHGYGYYLFPSNLQRWLSENIIALNSLAAYFTLQFALYFLRFSQSNGRIFFISWYISFALIAYTVFALISPEYISAQGFALAQAITYIVIMRLLYIKARTNFSWTKYYLISWIPFFIGAAIGYMLFTGIVSYSFLTRHALMFSVIFEMALISMALADRLGDTERRRLYQATHDFKLGLANESLLEEAIKRYAEQNNPRGLSLITIEILNYDAVIPYIQESLINKLMHALGGSFAEQLGRSLDLLQIDPINQKHDRTALLRGEMFSFLVRCDNPLLIETALKEISNRDNFNPLQDRIPYRIQCIFGAAILSDHDQPLELINQAKRSVSLAAETSATFHLYNPTKNTDSNRKVRLAQDLGNAIRNSSLALYHQPQIFLKDLQLCSSEVLLRWQHPELGEITPTEFVQIAEETGLIKRLTRWVLNQAFVQAKTLLAAGYQHLNISINISANDLSRQGFVEDIKGILQRHHLSASVFTLEVTETAHLTDKKTFEANFLSLRQLGFKFAIDDFGTGYSSLTYANDHPFSELKIDRSFIQDLLTSKRQLTIVSATISMAKELGLHITAEGVEDEQTLYSLKMLGCDKIQGYQIAKPMPLEDYLNWSYHVELRPAEIGENLSIHFNENDRP